MQRREAATYARSTRVHRLDILSVFIAKSQRRIGVTCRSENRARKFPRRLFPIVYLKFVPRRRGFEILERR